MGLREVHESVWTCDQCGKEEHRPLADRYRDEMAQMPDGWIVITMVGSQSQQVCSRECAHLAIDNPQMSKPSGYLDIARRHLAESQQLAEIQQLKTVEPGGIFRCG